MKILLNMDLGYLYLQMEDHMKVNGLKISCMVKENYTIIQDILVIKVNGEMVCSREMGKSSINNQLLEH